MKVPIDYSDLLTSKLTYPYSLTNQPLLNCCTIINKDIYVFFTHL